MISGWGLTPNLINMNDTRLSEADQTTHIPREQLHVRE